ncbi:hypothetical protein IFM89_005621, partial [Coptis chinensis]
RSVARFIPKNRNHRLDNMFSYYHLSERNSKWNYDQWLINLKLPDRLLKLPDGHIAKIKQIYDFYAKLLTEVIGSEEETKKRLYVMWFELPFGFGVEIDEKTLNKLKGLVDVLTVLPDYAYDLKDKDRGGMPINHMGHVFLCCYLLKSWFSELGHPNRPMVILVSTFTYKPTDSLLKKDLSSVSQLFISTSHSVSEFTPLNQKNRLNDFFSYHHLSKFNLEWNFDNWIIYVKQPDGEFIEQQKIDFCIRTLAEVVGSEEDAKKKIYVVWCKMPYGFGAEIDGEISNKLKGGIFVQD